MRINRPLFYNQHYYFDKQELGEDIKPILNSKKDDIEIKNKKDELFDLYRAGQLERLCGIQPTEIEWMPALDAIGRCFELTTEVSINLTNYCSVNGVYIGCPHNPDIQIEPTVINQPNSINTFKVNPFCLDLDAIHNENVIFDISYTIHGTVSQNLIPSLEFYSKEKLKQQYFSSEELIVDLSQIGQRTISFEIPAMDIFTQNEGYYILKLGTFDFAKIEFPRCGLPINEGIYSLAELRDFCDKLSGSPTDEMISFYELLKNGIITQWLQDNDEEGKYKREIYEAFWKIQAKHPFRINDLNAILKIISNRIITFPMKEYLSIAISKIISTDIIGKQRVNDKFYYFVPWNSTTNGKLKVVITPTEICKNLDIDFNLDVKAQSTTLVDNFHINLRDIETREKKALDFRITVPDEQKMGESNIYIHDKQGYTQETKVYFVVTGEKVPIPLLNGSSITMIGVYSLKHKPFYIAQTPLTQEQVRLLIQIAENKKIYCSDLKDAHRKSTDYSGANDNLPNTFLDYGQTSDIKKILNSLVKKYKFEKPEIEELELALRDGVVDKAVVCPNKQYNKIQPISLEAPMHSTELGLIDMLGNVLSFTESSTGGFLGGYYLAFGTTYFDSGQKTVLRREVKGDIDRYMGYRPKMVKISSAPTTPKRDYETNDVVDADTWLADRWTTEIDF